MKAKSSFDPAISIMKGLAIIAVVAGHLAVGGFGERFCNQFHLAAFFFVSGYLFNLKYVGQIASYVVKKVKRLYFPFVMITIVGVLCHNLFERLYLVNDVYSYKEILRYCFGALMFNCSENMFGAMWFCKPLLLVSLVVVSLYFVSGKLCRVFQVIVTQLFMGGGNIDNWCSCLCT